MASASSVFGTHEFEIKLPGISEGRTARIEFVRLAGPSSVQANIYILNDPTNTIDGAIANIAGNCIICVDSGRQPTKLSVFETEEQNIIIEQSLSSSTIVPTFTDAPNGNHILSALAIILPS